MAKSETDRKQRYLQLCEDSGSSSSSGHDSSISAALVSWNAREVLLSNGQTDNQHALLGYLPMTDGQKEPVLINTEHPWSAFICGSQGSGKSYTTSCVLEGCLSSSDQIGTLKQPMAGMVFRYDRYGTGICEAATLCTGRAAVKVKVLLSPFNFANVKPKYENIKKGSNDGMLQIQTFYIQSSHLNAERIHKFMASNDGSKPLYMSVCDPDLLLYCFADMHRLLTEFYATWVCRIRDQRRLTSAHSATKSSGRGSRKKLSAKRSGSR
jgi:hypothetical protein